MFSATTTQKTKLGLFLLVTGGLLALILLLFAGLSLMDRPDRYYVETGDNVSGLRIGAPVEVRGVDVGQVAEVTLARGRQPITLALDIEKGTPVPAGARAVLRSQGVTGLMYVNIEGGDFLGRLLEPGNKIPSAPSALSEITDQGAALVRESRQLIVRGTQLADQANDVLGADNRARIERILARGEEILSHGEAAMSSLERAAAQVARTSSRLESLVADHGEPMLEAAGGLIGDARRVVQANRNSIGGAVLDLREAARSFRHLAESLERDPSRILFRRDDEERRR